MKPPPPHRVVQAGPRVIVQAAPKSKVGNHSISAGWLVLIFGFVVACIPVLGFFAWVIGGFLCLAAFVLAIVGMANGRAFGGLFLLCGAVIGAPVAYFIAPLVATHLATDSAGEASKALPQPGEQPPPGFVPRDYKPEAK